MAHVQSRAKGRMMAFGTFKKYLLFLSIFMLVHVFSGCSAPQSGVASLDSSDESTLEVSRLSLKDAKAAFDDGTALFLDVRTSGAYLHGHIPGAKSIPLGELERRFGEIDPDQWIITYCT